MLEFEHLACRRGRRLLFRGLAMRVGAGELLRVTGANGAGKTSLLRMICGLMAPAEGRVLWQGAPLAPQREAYHRQLLYLGHAAALKDELSALENLVLFGRIFGLKDPRRSAMEWLERTGLAHVRDGLVREFSRGMRQRLAVARAFLHDPEVLLLDEP
ncbi:MAG: heme ABC exporter ATP-binding protein CcmA, partial [Rubrivivax sp.]|nr:heme ABC exporter ATP-binding protein CcmA [Rubrivivax sp.]